MHLHRQPAPPWDGYTVKQSYFLCAFVLYVLIFLFLSLAVEPDATTVFLATFPIILSVVLYSLVSSVHPRRRLMLLATLVTPIFSTLFFVALVMSRISVDVNAMDAASVIIWQLLTSFMLLIFSWLFVTHSSKNKYSELQKPHEIPTPTNENAMYRQTNMQHNNQNAAQREQILKALQYPYAQSNSARNRNQSPIYYDQIVSQYAKAAREHAQYATQLQSELATAQATLSTTKLSAAKEDEYRSKIAALEQKLAHEKSVAQDATTRNSDYETHIKNLQSIVDRLKDKLDVSDKNFTTRLRGVEDKAKAINFVIGRVYSDKNGGNVQIREKLNIDRALYNAFSEMSSDVSVENKKKLITVLEAISKKLITLELPESELFRLPPRTKLVRSANMKDTILEVLAKNDTDPVLDYFVEAKEICSNMLQYLRK